MTVHQRRRLMRRFLPPLRIAASATAMRAQPAFGRLTTTAEQRAIGAPEQRG
jgi:hypothetical protein